MTINLYRNLISYNNTVRLGEGRKDLGIGLARKKFELTGLGAIGKSVASITNAFGCKIRILNCGKLAGAGIDVFEQESRCILAICCSSVPTKFYCHT